MRAVSISDRYEATEGTVLLSGIEALVRLLLTQRDLDRARDLSTALFISGYEGSPLGGLDQQLQRAHDLLSAADIVFSPGLNEELAATAVGGTQLTGELPGRRVDGVVGFWYGKNPGLDRAADAIRHASMSGTAPLGGAVAIVGDDPMAKSSTLPSSCEQMAQALSLPVLAPSSVGDIIPLGLHAVALSRHAGLWSALKIVADLADASATVALPALGALGIPAPDRSRLWQLPTLLGPGRARGGRGPLFGALPPRARVHRTGRAQPHHPRAPATPHGDTGVGHGLRGNAARPGRPRAQRNRAAERPRAASHQDRPALAPQPSRVAGNGARRGRGAGDRGQSAGRRRPTQVRVVPTTRATPHPRQGRRRTGGPSSRATVR